MEIEQESYPASHTARVKTDSGPVESTSSETVCEDPGAPPTMADYLPRQPKKVQPPPGTICRFYLQGKCWAGVQCRWIHPPSMGPMGRQQIVATPYGPMLVNLPPNALAAVFDASTGMIVANMMEPTSLAPTENGSKDETPQSCFYWRQGHCRFGADCRYTHGQ